MREKEMRLRVFRFLKARMRNMIMPATVGIGLAVAGGCESAAVYSAPFEPVEHKDAATLKQDVALGPDSPGPDSVVVADVAVESAPDSPTPADVLPPDALATETGLDTGSRDVKDDLNWVKYGSPFDSGTLDTRVVDSQTEVGQVIAKYIAPMPDAAVDSSSPVVRYMAVMPDASPDLSVAVLYMAQLPS